MDLSLIGVQATKEATISFMFQRGFGKSLLYWLVSVPVLQLEQQGVMNDIFCTLIYLLFPFFCIFSLFLESSIST